MSLCLLLTDIGHMYILHYSAPNLIAKRILPPPKTNTAVTETKLNQYEQGLVSDNSAIHLVSSLHRSHGRTQAPAALKERLELSQSAGGIDSHRSLLQQKAQILMGPCSCRGPSESMPLADRDKALDVDARANKNLCLGLQMNGATCGQARD